MMPKSVIKVICIIMAALMILSVGAVILQVIAVDSADFLPLAMPATGDNDADYLIPAGIGVLAILAVGICLVLPKLKKK
ncbi:MAG: hypothetical protein IKB94_03000 [Clostridia bacterium]|nr:hypothetical protein [Clostridia bacterium]MBR2892800.1 hypothetical protein [Clostridia bacterium]